VWQAGDGGLFLPYDPGELIRNYWSERYRDIGAQRLGALAKKAAVTAYITERQESTYQYDNFGTYGQQRPVGTAVSTAVPGWFADTEEVTGSNPVAPTNKALTSANDGQFAVWGRFQGLCTGWRAFPA
jgi:hypothetical protein